MKKSILLILLLYVLYGCQDEIVSPIPYRQVYLQLNLTASYPIFKNSVNQYLIFDRRINVTDAVGYGGILLYTGFDGNYYAFDMSCPYEANSNIKVRPNNLGQAICDSCHSVFDISWGVANPIPPSKATKVLKHYKASLYGDVLYVIN